MAQFVNFSPQPNIRAGKFLDAVVNGSRIKLLCSKSLVALRISRAPQFAFPQERKGEEQDGKTNSADRVEHIGHSDAADPRGHGEDKDGAHCVPRKSKRHKGITDDLGILLSASSPVARGTHLLLTSL